GYADARARSASTNFMCCNARSTTLVPCPARPYPYSVSAQSPGSPSLPAVPTRRSSDLPDYSNNTGAGSATASYTYAGDANHSGSGQSKKRPNGQASWTTVATCPAGPYTYSGSAQTPGSASGTGVGGLSLAPTPDYSNNT